MHDQVVGAGAVRGCVCDEFPDCMPLMETREDHGLDVGVAAARCRRPAFLGVLVLHVQESVDQVQPRVSLPDLFPQVRGPVAACYCGGRVTRATRLTGAVRARVERQEPCFRPCQPGGNEREVRIDGEVHEGTAGEDQLLGIPGGTVLVPRLLRGLARRRILQLCRRDRDAVEEQRQVYGLPWVLRRVAELPRDHEPVGKVLVQRAVGERVARAEVRQPDRDATVLHTVAEHVQRPAVVDLAGDQLRQFPLRGIDPAVRHGQLLDLIRLRLLDERFQLGRIQAKLR